MRHEKCVKFFPPHLLSLHLQEQKIEARCEKHTNTRTPKVANSVSVDVFSRLIGAAISHTYLVFSRATYAASIGLE